MEPGPLPAGKVVALARSAGHSFSKQVVDEVRLIAGQGVEDDAHLGEKVQHLSRVRVDPDQPNLRQVHLIGEELLDELALEGFALSPGQLGENVTTRGIDLLALPQRSVLKIGDSVELEVTGLRNPCAQIEAFRPGLLARVVSKDSGGNLIRRAGIMAVVRSGGQARAGDEIKVVLPAGAHLPLERV
jgi:MOSC domain-containing protein YiiM